MDPMSDRQAGEWVDRQIEGFLQSGPPDGNPELGWRLLQYRQAQSRVRTVRRRWIAIAAAGLVAVVSAVPPARAYVGHCLDACVAGSEQLRVFVVQRLRTSETIISTGDGERRVAADFSAVAADGRTIHLSDYRGQVVVLNFWATWCHPCRTEIPWFVEFQRTYKAQGLTVLGVSLDEDGWIPVQPFLAEYGVNYPVITGRPEVAAAFGGVESVPTTLIIDRRGRVAATYVGLVSKAIYEQRIRALLSEWR